ncbi:MAG TPA: thioredoxin family protein [Verrucomicrobiae bacterium]|nr:thioredoxin family protein [Verrucomicrobiae bacterium]
MKKSIAVMAVIFLTLTAGAFAAVDWEQSYDLGLEKAKKNKKLMMVDMYTDWCGWCKKLDKDTYSDKAVGDKVAKDFVAVKLNPEKSSKGAELSKQFGTTGFPHIVFVDSAGHKVSEINGYLPPKEFLKSLEMISDKATKK